MAKPPSDNPDLRTAIDAVFAKARRSRSPYGVASELAAMLAPCIERLEALIETGRSTEAEPLLKRIVTASEAVMNRIDDSNARFYPLCAHAVTLWGRSWARIEPRQPRKLAAMVKKCADDSGFSIRDRIVEDFADALGEPGLAALRDLYLEELGELPRIVLTDPTRYSREACDRIRERSSVIRKLQAIADARRDVDGFIELAELDGGSDHEGIAIGRRLVDAGRHAEALEWVDRAIRADPEGDPDQPHDEPHGAGMVRALALRGLGRMDEAAETLWQEFGRRPGAALLRAIHEISEPATAAGAPAQQDSAQAVAVASRHEDPHEALRFLMEIAEYGHAATLVEARCAELDGHRYDVLVPLAEALEATPAPDRLRAAWRCLDALLRSILDDGRRTAYRHAAHYLVRMRRLAPGCGLVEAHAALEAELAKAHRMKKAFWQEVEWEEE
jgi:tetratricopeptide (TPR) repeat protein